MKSRILNLRRLILGCVVSVSILGMAFIYASDQSKGGEKHDLRRIAKIKGSTGNAAQNMGAQVIFQPGKQSEVVISVKSGNKTYRLEMVINSKVDTDEPWHSIEAKFVEQIGKAKPVIQHHPRLRTIEGVPASLEIGNTSGEGFSFEILIEPIN